MPKQKRKSRKSILPKGGRFEGKYVKLRSDELDLLNERIEYHGLSFADYLMQMVEMDIAQEGSES